MLFKFGSSSLGVGCDATGVREKIIPLASPEAIEEKSDVRIPLPTASPARKAVGPVLGAIRVLAVVVLIALAGVVLACASHRIFDGGGGEKSGEVGIELIAVVVAVGAGRAEFAHGLGVW